MPSKEGTKEMKSLQEAGIQELDAAFLRGFEATARAPPLKESGLIVD